MLEHTKKPPTNTVVLSFAVPPTLVEEVRTFMQNKGIAESDGCDIDELFPNHHAGHSIRGLRYREGMTQTALAKTLGISAQNLSHIEHGRRAIGRNMAKRIAEIFDTNWRLFL